MVIGIKNIDGFDDYQITDTLLSGYTAITSVANWLKVSDYMFKDYKFVRKRLQEEAVLNYSGMTADEQRIICKYKAIDEDTCKSVLGDLYEYWMTDFDLKSQESRMKRFTNAKTCLIKNISLMDRFTVLGYINSTTLERDYIYYGLEGTNDGDPIPGMLDFIEATVGTPYETTGMAARTFTMIGTITKEEMIAKIVDILRNGNY